MANRSPRSFIACRWLMRTRRGGDAAGEPGPVPYGAALSGCDTDIGDPPRVSRLRTESPDFSIVTLARQPGKSREDVVRRSAHAWGDAASGAVGSLAGQLAP